MAKNPGRRGKKKAAPTQDQQNPLFAPRVKNFRIGGDIQPKRDLYRFVRWPEYIQLQRKRSILLKRLKVPPPVNQFRRTFDKSQAASLFRMLLKYKPEARSEKRDRLRNEAQGQSEKTKPVTLKYGLNQVTYLIEEKKARLVVIAHDVEPLELVVWLPELCRSMDVPYCIVKSKSRLGALVHKKTTAVVALTEVRKEDVKDLDLLTNACRQQFNDNPENTKWGEGVLGSKSQHKEDLKKKKLEIEMRKKAGF